MKKLILCLLTLSLCLAGCQKTQAPQKTRYTASFLNLFDTVTNVVGFADSKAAFEQEVQKLHDSLEEYHRLFDIYNDYEGLPNLKTVNDRAGIEPVTVDGRIIALLKDCKTYYELTGGAVNVAFGGVLKLWHEARQAGIQDPENAKLPEKGLLEEAAAHVAMDAVILDEAASTVYLSDAKVQLDVGAVAKGWAVQQVCKAMPEGYLVSVGGNVCATGPKPDGTSWVVGIQDPNGGDKYLKTMNVTKTSVVTSGDYQRAYTVAGKQYHHIIDPKTLYPGTLWRSVSVICEDSGLADALSTALFLLPRAEGQRLLDKYGAMALWVDTQGTVSYSPGLNNLMR